MILAQECYNVPPAFEIDKVAFGPLAGISFEARLIAAYAHGLLEPHRKPAVPEVIVVDDEEEDGHDATARRRMHLQVPPQRAAHAASGVFITPARLPAEAALPTGACIASLGAASATTPLRMCIVCGKSS